MNISILIATRNRASTLKKCLASLSTQIHRTDQIVICDNSSEDETRNIVSMYKKSLPIQYIYEKRVGLPYARNALIKKSSRDIVAFIDDDCMADEHWLEAIHKHFARFPLSVGVIGKTKNITPENKNSQVEYLYYLSWISTYVPDLGQTQQIRAGNIIDFKNAAFRYSFMKKFRFSTDIPFGEVGDEDLELGIRLYKANSNIYFNPSIKVSHLYSQTLGRLILRNFLNGFANESLRLTHSIHSPSVKISLNSKNFLTFLYPIFSRAGRVFALLVHKFRLSFNMPRR